MRCGKSGARPPSDGCFFFYQYQALFAVFFALPALVVAHHARPHWTGWDLAGILIWLCGVGNTMAADRQLARFRARPENRGKTCRAGWWRYSRHPNYFFEWLHWWAYAALAAGTAFWWIAWLVPLVLLYLFFRVTGIPPTEAQALASRGRGLSPLSANYECVHSLVSQKGKIPMNILDLAERVAASGLDDPLGHPSASGFKTADRAAAKRPMSQGPMSGSLSKNCAAARSRSRQNPPTSSTTKCPRSFFSMCLVPG